MLDDVDCDGDERFLTDCKSGPIECVHGKEEASVECSGIWNIHSVKLKYQQLKY